MPEWLKVAVLIAVLGGWLGTVVFALSKGSLPDAATLGVPAVVIAALYPPGRLWGRRGQAEQSEADDVEQAR